MDLATTADTLAREIAWLEQVIDSAVKWYFQAEGEPANGAAAVLSVAAPELAEDASFYASTLVETGLSLDERLLLILALASDIKPQIFDPFLIRNKATDRVFSEFGGITDAAGTYTPTVETALFVLARGDLGRRLQLMRCLSADAPLITHKLLKAPRSSEHGFSRQALEPDAHYRARLTTGSAYGPGIQEDFPARRLTTRLRWDDLVLPAQTRHEIGEILAWIEHGEALAGYPGLGRMIRPGYRSLFFGPPGTGKTLTATLLGQAAGREVYQVDLSLVVSKWIGETEKNLGRVFDQAERSGWLLFFDEADALFGKRSNVTQSNDRHANQEVSYILQRMENFAGILLLASNLRGNIDAAFARRFESIIHFPMPGPAERLRLWQTALGNDQHHGDDFDLAQIAQRHELTGGAIVNVARFCVLEMLRTGNDTISHQLLLRGVAREMRKDGKMPEVEL